MLDISALRQMLTHTAQSTRIVVRCLINGRDSQETPQRAVSLLIDILELLYNIKDQISWAEEKWIVQQTRLDSLGELLTWFDSTMKSIDLLYPQPGGVGVSYFRKRLLQMSFLPRLEKYKVIFLLAMQPDSNDRSFLHEELRNTLSSYRDVDSVSPAPDLQVEEHALGQASGLASAQFMTLEDLGNRRQKGTCSWIFRCNEYQEWLFGSFRSLHCFGPPGVGKTFLSSAIIDSLQRTFTSSDVATVFIFCQDGKDKVQTMIDLLRNILAQLVYRKRSLSYATSSLHHSESLMEGSASPKAYQNAIRAEVNRFSKVYVVVDGLDMLPDKERVLNRLQKLPAQVLVMLREANYADDATNLSILAPPEDIQLYTLSRILLDPAIKRHFKQDPCEVKLQEVMIHSVVERSHGIFLLAKLHMDLLSRYSDRKLVERVLFHLPESLNEAYGEAMKHVVSSNPSAARRIYWNLYAFRPLSVEELRCATINPNTEGQNESLAFKHSLQIQSAGLLTIDAVTGTVRFIHNTAKEYLTGAAARVFFPNAQRDIAEVCLAVITPDEVVDDCYINDGRTPRNTCGSFLDYAATYWGHHARAVDEDELTIPVLIKTFLNKLLWRRPPKSFANAKAMPSELGLGKYPNDWDALHILAFFGIMGKSKRLLEQGADIDGNHNSLGMTPLHCASSRGNDEVVEFLLDNGADGNAAAKDGSTPLHMATQQGHRKVMKLLLSRRVNSRTANGHGATSLQLAVGTATDEATVPLLVKNRVDVNIRNIRTGNTALHLAVEWRRPRIILFLLEKGVGINLTNEDGLTPLQLAASSDNCEAIPLLLQRGAQVEGRSLAGLTALQLAAHNGHWIAFDLLMIGGADVNSWNNEGETLLHEQARNPFNVSIASKLLDHGAYIEARSSQGFTPLQCAVMAGNRRLVAFLLDKGANIEAETAKGESLLHITSPANIDCLEILRALLEHGLDVHSVSSQGWTPLHQAIYIGTGTSDFEFDNITEYIQLLLTYGADINSRAASATEETPLHLAVMALASPLSLVSLLIETGADVNAVTSEGKAPLYLAGERGREDICRILVDAGADMSLEIPGHPAGDPEKAAGQTAEAGNMDFELAKKDPLSAMLFKDEGKLCVPSEQSRRGSASTIFEDLSPRDFDGGTKESTLVGSEQGYIVV